MKKMISLAVILSCVLSAQAFADGPNDGHRPGQQQVWQNGPKQGDQNGHHQPGGPGDHHQGNNDSRGPDRRGHDDRHQERHEQDHFAWRGNDFRKGSSDRNHYLNTGKRRPRSLNNDTCGMAFAPGQANV